MVFVLAAIRPWDGGWPQERARGAAALQPFVLGINDFCGSVAAAVAVKQLRIC